VIATALAKSPADRYSTCGELAASAQAALHGKAVGRRRKRTRRLTIAAAVAALAGIAVGLVFTVGGGGEGGVAHAAPLALLPNGVDVVDVARPRVLSRTSLASRSVYGIERRPSSTRSRPRSGPYRVSLSLSMSPFPCIGGRRRLCGSSTS
jgi:hypothetical protein